MGELMVRREGGEQRADEAVRHSQDVAAGMRGFGWSWRGFFCMHMSHNSWLKSW